MLLFSRSVSRLCMSSDWLYLKIERSKASKRRNLNGYFFATKSHFLVVNLHILSNINAIRRTVEKVSMVVYAFLSEVREAEAV